jgi:hypothetical protein
MASRAAMASIGLFVVGVILAAVGAVIEPLRTATNPISDTAESLIAIGLTLVVWAIGLFLAWAGPS